MRATVAFPISPKPLEEGQELKYINEELLKLLPQVRTFANLLSWESKTVTTDGSGAFFNLWTSATIPTSSTSLVTAFLCATYPSTLLGGEWAAFLVTAAFALGTQIGSTTTLFSAKAAGAINFQYVYDGTANTISIQVRDHGLGAGYALKWTGIVVTCEGAQ